MQSAVIGIPTDVQFYFRWFQLPTVNYCPKIFKIPSTIEDPPPSTPSAPNIQPSALSWRDDSPSDVPSEGQ